VRRSLPPPALVLLALGAFAACGACVGPRGGEESGGLALAAAPAAAPRAPWRKIAIRTADRDAALERAIRDGGFFRWALPDLPDLEVEVGPRAGGELVLLVDVLPAAAATQASLRGLPLAFEDGAVLLGGVRYARHALAARLPATRTPTWLIVAPTADAAADLADRLLVLNVGLHRERGAPDFDYLLRESRYLERRGRWRTVRHRNPQPAWEIDPASERDDIAARDRFYAELVRLPGGHAELRVPADLAARREVVALAAELDRAAAAMARRVPVTLAGPVTLIAERDFVAQGRHTGTIGEAVPGPRADLHLVLHPGDGFAYRHALAATLLGSAGVAQRLPPWLARGAALWLSEDWYGRPWREWLPLLAAAGALPTADELLAEREQRDGSPPLWTPAAAAVVDALPGSTVAEKLAATPSRERIAAALAALAGLRPEPPLRPGTEPPPRLPSGFLAGVSLAMSNSLEDGYHAAPAIDRSLDTVRHLGANAVSLMPFAFQRGLAAPELAFVHDSPGGETDVGLVHAARRCRARGVSVLWKPHIWARGGWTGDIAMDSEEDWRRWWASYHRYVLHHAFLARWAEADLFSIGVELLRTLDRREEWRRLIAGVRVLYPGPVTYSGNWYGDLDRAPFWDDLDLIGVDAYFPLAASPAASRDELVAGARGVAEKLGAAARRHGKPVLLTEVGFAARRGAWIEPHSEGGEVSLADQARAYEALFAGLGRPLWLAGTYVWKVHSGAVAGGEPSPLADFDLLGRPAAAVVRSYYSAD
jgi:hypothetical protein